MNAHTTNCQIATIIAEHGAMIERVVGRTLRAAGHTSESMREEVTADVISHLYEKAIPAYDGSGTVKGYVAMIAKRETIKCAERAEVSTERNPLNVSGLMEHKSKEGDSMESAGKDGKLPLAQAHSPRELVIRREQVEALLDAMAELDATEHAVIRGMLGGRAGVEIADELGISQVQVTRAKTKALGKIRANMA